MSKILMANWKMNQTLESIKNFFVDTSRLGLENRQQHKLVICPQALHLGLCKELAFTTGQFEIGAQDCAAWQKEFGAYTGDISAYSLAEMGAKYVLIGHSERRQYYQESSSFLAQKITNALKASLIPVYCLGEQEQHRKEGIKKILEVLLEQLNVFSTISPTILQGKHLLFAYEPVWAIGTGLTPTVEQVQEIHQFIQRWHVQFFQDKHCHVEGILYGGSVTPENIASFLSLSEIQGALIGGASLDGKKMAKMVLECQKIA